jgi:hypothetical protein
VTERLLASGDQPWIERHAWHLTEFIATAFVASAAGNRRQHAGAQGADDAGWNEQPEVTEPG